MRINARSDNLSGAAVGRTPLHKRRCLVPVSGYFEWRKADKVPFRFTLSDQPIYAFAGFWDAWNSPAVDWLQSHLDANDPQNLLSALTSAVLVGLLLALLASAALLLFLRLFAALRSKSTASASPPQHA
jgi:hypothetical protein